jgi:hypothetical protein
MFLLGHWKATGHPRQLQLGSKPIGPAIQGMIDWLNNRQQAVADARAAHPAPT